MRDEQEYNYLIKLPTLNKFFIDIPKTGCSSMKLTLLRNERNYSNHVNFGVGHRSWQEMFPECKVSNSEINDQTLAFAVVRNPYERLISMYRNIYLGREKGDKDFMSFCLSLNDLMKKPFTNITNNHYRPCSFFTNQFNIKPENLSVFKLENIEECHDYLREIGVNKELLSNFPHMNKSSNKNSRVEFVFKEPMLSVVNKLFHDDFIIGNYEIKYSSFSLFK